MGVRREQASERTSGKVPLEKTLWHGQHASRAAAVWFDWALHEQAGLSAGTVTNNDQLATDLRHLRECVNDPSDRV